MQFYLATLPPFPVGNQASYANFSEFSVVDGAQKRFGYSTKEALDSKQLANFRSNYAEYSGTGFRFLVIEEVTTGKSIQYEKNREDEAGKKLQVNVGKVTFNVEFNNSASISCTGKDNACIIQSQLWRMVPKPDGATGHQFVPDTSVLSGTEIFKDSKYRF